MASGPAQAKSLYEEGEKVLCFCNSLLYEAKCLQCRVNAVSNATEYLVHYQGWNRNWDEWVPEHNVFKYNDENLEMQFQFKKAHTSINASKRIRNSKKAGKDQKSADEGSINDPDSSNSPSTSSVENKNRLKETRSKIKSAKDNQSVANIEVKEDVPTKCKVEPNPAGPSELPAVIEGNSDLKRVLTEEVPTVPEKKIRRSLRVSDIHFTKVPFISNAKNGKIKIPLNLEKWLKDDYDQITRLNRLVNLPVTVTVTEILLRYLSDRTDKYPDKSEVLLQTASSVEKLFCCCLGSYLLYKWERPQYSDILERRPGIKISEIYGAIHFLRLLVKIGDVVSSLLAERVTSLVDTVEDLLNFLVEKEKDFFLTENYGISTPDYHRRAI